MSPAEKKPAGAQHGSPPMVPHRYRSPAWSTGPAVLVLVLLSALQHPVQGLTVPPDGVFEIGDLWPSEESLSSAVSEILPSYGQEETENTTLIYNTTSSSQQLNVTNLVTSIQDNTTAESEADLGPSESPVPSPFQPTDSGLSDAGMLPLLKLLVVDGFVSSSPPSYPSSLPSLSSTSSSSLPPLAQTFLSVTDVSSSTIVPYINSVAEGGVFTQDTSTDVNYSSSYATSNNMIVSATTIGTSDLVKNSQTQEVTQASQGTESTLDLTTGDSLGQTDHEIKSSSVNVTSLPSETTSMRPIYASSSESVTESNADLSSTTVQPPTTFSPTFTISSDTVNVSAQAHRTIESSSNLNTSTAVQITVEEGASSIGHSSTGSIESISSYSTDTTVTRSGETSVEATRSSVELSPSPKTMMSTFSVTTSTLLNPSSASFSVQPSDVTNVEHTSKELSSIMPNTNTIAHLTRTEISTRFSPTLASEVTISVVPSINMSSTAPEEQHTPSVTNGMTSRTSMAPSETQSEVSLSFKPYTLPYPTNTTTEVLPTVHIVDNTSRMLTNTPNEGNTKFSNSSTALSTLELSTSGLAESTEINTTKSSEVTSAVTATTLTISLDATSIEASNKMVDVTSPLETNTLTTFNSRSSPTLPSETLPETSTFTNVNDASTNTGIQQTYSTGGRTRIVTSSHEDSVSAVREPITSTHSTSITTVESKSNLDVSEVTTKPATDNSSAMSRIGSTPQVTESSEKASSVKTTTLTTSLDATRDMTLITSNKNVSLTSSLETNTPTMFYAHSGATLALETMPETSTFTTINDASTTTEIQQTYSVGEATHRPTSSQEDFRSTLPEPITLTFSNLTTSLKSTSNLGVSKMTTQLVYDHTSATSTSKPQVNESSEVTPSLKTTTLTSSFDPTSDMGLWTSNNIVIVTSSVEANSSSMVTTHSGVTPASETPPETSTIDTENKKTSSTDKTTHVAVSSQNDLTSSVAGTITSTLSTLKATFESTSNLGDNKTTTQSVIGNSSSTSDITNESSEVTPSLKTTTLTSSLDATSDMGLWTSNDIVIVTSSVEANSSLMVTTHSGATPASETPPETSTIDTENMKTSSTDKTTHVTVSSQNDLTSSVAGTITSTLSTLKATFESTSNLGDSEMTTQSVIGNSSSTSDITIVKSPQVNTTAVTVSTQSAVTNGLETLPSSWGSTETSTKSMHSNSTPYSTFTSSSDTTTLRPTHFYLSTTSSPSSLPTSNFGELSTYFNTHSGQSTSNVAGISEVTSSLVPSTIAPSSGVTLDHGLWTITDNTMETSTSTLPSTLNVSPRESSTQSTNISTTTESLSMSSTLNISSPHSLFSELTSPLFSKLTQVSSSDNTSSTTSTTKASENTTTHVTLMVSSRQSMDSSALSTDQTSSRSSDFHTTSDGLQSATTIETSTSTLPSTLNVSPRESSTQSTNISATIESLSMSYTLNISSPHSMFSGLTSPLFSKLTQVSSSDNTSSTTPTTTASENTRNHVTVIVSSRQSMDSSALSTDQTSSRSSDYQTSSDGLRDATTKSLSTVTSLLSQPSTQSQSLASTTVDVANFNGSTTHKAVTTLSMLHTTSLVSSTTIPSTHSSSFSPFTTTIFPTNISDSLSTVSSGASSAEVSTVSTTGNATQNFTSTEKPSTSSSVTLTTPTTHVSPSIIYTLLSTQSSKSAQTPTFGVVTTATTPIAPTNHTIHTPTTVVSTTTLQTTTLTSTASTTTHGPTTDTVTTLSDATKVSSVLPHTITSSTTTPTTTTPRTSVASVAPITNATDVSSTTPTTMLSTTTTPSSFECSLSTETMVKTVLTMTYQPQPAEKETIAQKFAEFLNFTLYRTLNQPIQVFLNRTSLNVTLQTQNVTLGYSISVNSSIYIPSAIVDVLTSNGVFNVTALNRYVSLLQSVPVPAETWEPDPDVSFRVKTVLKLMGTGTNVHTCVYVRNMEQKLQTAYERASTVVTNLSVKILSTSKVDQSLSLIYVVKNNGILLNGTTASSMLNVLSGEVVGYYLGDPPSIIAEPLYYPNIDTSDSTMNYWVYTVIQGVDDQLLGQNNQSFARQMEERLAQLFQISSQQSRRFRRATTVGSYTVQMVKMERLAGANNQAMLTYYTLKDGQPLLGTVAAKQLSTIDPQTMALTLGYIVKVQANSVVQKPPNNLWIIAAVLAPIAVVTVIIIIITAVLCRKNKSDFKSENIGNLPPRTKPVQGFDYAKQHLGQTGGDEEMLPVTQETVVPSLNLSQERDSTKDGSTEKMLKSSDHRKSRSPCENGSVISNESEEASSDGSTPQKVMAQHRVTKDEAGKRNVPISDEEEGNIHKMLSDPFDSSSGSVQLIAIKPVSGPPALTVSDRNQEMSIINGEVNKALKQKSDIEHYRNKLRLKAKRKGYYDFPPVESKSLNERKRKVYAKTQMEIDNVLDAGTDTSSPFAEPKNRQSSMKNHPYRSRQSLNSPSPGETEMDLLVTRERPRRGIRNSGYDTEPEIIEETNIDRVKQARTYIKSRQAKGHSETSTLSSQPSIDEVRQQMHMLLEEAFSLASAGHREPKRQADPYASVQHMPYSEVVTSAPGTMSRPRMQWVPTYGPEMYQYSLPRPNYRFSQLPEMVIGSPPPPVPPRTGPVAVPSLRRSTSDMANKGRMPEPARNETGPGEHVGLPPVARVPVPVTQTDQSVTNYSGNSMPAVFAIPGNRAGYSGYYIPQPPASYRNQAWMSYSGENDLQGQWADSVPLPGYIEAYPRSRYPQNSPSRLPRQFSQPVNLHPSLDHATGPSIGASQQSLADTDTPDASITNLSTAALVKAIREEVAKLAKKQTDMFEFQV
ncbi:UPF0606 protein KIAA1549L homolog isoform X2 [Engystomops pustulosus]|uniref:UPF0606 protein KIAA1549L homolog isoform X2 n=1 Tax=Engystomops pustulosus TaxID=76066 RepID=UPI003AFB38AE